MKVLDIACGRGRHSVAAAAKGCYVTAVDQDASRFKEAQEYCASKNHHVTWLEEDLEKWSLPEREFDAVLVFNYLDRTRMAAFREAVKPGGYLLCETFTTWQRGQGWGPTSDDHLLEPGEILDLIGDFELIAAREVLEMVEGNSMSAASAFARRPA